MILYFKRIKTPLSKISYYSSCVTTHKMRLQFHLLQCLLILSTLMGLSKPDPDPLQDYCVADTSKPQTLFLNGVPCINPNKASSSHFATSALSKPGNTSANQYGFNVTLTTTANLPGVNTMGLTIARVDIAADGIVPLHTHPRASEVTTCLKGALLVGFVDTANRVFSQQLRPGDSFVFPKGLIHFLYNIDEFKPALAVSGLSSQNPGAQIVSGASFTSKPDIPEIILEKTYKISAADAAIVSSSLGGYF